jgi:two-component system, NtrC family, sensor kinase
MNCPRCEQDNPSHAVFCLKCGTRVTSGGKDDVAAASYTDLQRSLTKALARESAIGDILRVIGSSPRDVQPVFDAIAESARRLLGGFSSGVFRLVGDEIHLAALTSTTPSGDAALRKAFPRPLSHFSTAAEAIRTRTPVVLSDLETAPRIPDDFRKSMRERGFRSGVWVPMLREGVAIGAIGVTRSEAGGFGGEEIALLETFADQAVIAIENVRLFNETKEALAQQTATSEILRVISSSPTDYQPVFDTIVRSAASVCAAQDAVLQLAEGDEFVVRAHHGLIGTTIGYRFPARGSTSGLTVREARVVHVEDLAEAADFPVGQDFARRAGYRTTLNVPLLREGVAIGVIGIRRTEVRLFTDKQIALLQTFADQAVIAIENVRLFKELEARNRELTTALDTQTATSDILRVISRSQTDVQPVFDAIVASAVRLLGAYSGTLTRVAGEQIELAAITSTSDVGDAALRARFPQPLSSAGPHARTIRDRAPLNIADAHTDPRLPEAVHAYARVRGYRSQVAVPMLHNDEAIGTISVTRREHGGFTDDEIALLQTFADQAVIAIENVRLFKELQARTGELTRSVGELRALGEVSQALSSTLDVDVVLNTIVTRANDLIGADGCTIFEYDQVTEQFHLRATRNLEPRLVELARGTPLRKGDQGILGQLPMGREAVQVPDITAGSYSSPISDALIEAGYRAVVAVPLIREDHLIGALTMNRKTPGEFPAETIELLQTFATQSALAIQNARLFRELADKSRQLEVASQHKSEFLANMSHELRTPLNAVIGFSEVLSERMFGELNEKQDEYLKDIHASGQHLLSLINDILDLSKIEAGRMELELTDFDLPMTIDNALTLVRERAARRGIEVHRTIDERLGQVQADERKIRQVLLNLLSNAIKFTPEGGRIDVGAKPVNGSIEVSVSDTGVGIAPEDQDAVFEEFRQVGTADKKVEGTGLGLALSRKFVELHGGKIWVKSQVGVGSTFTFTIPVRRGE